MEVWVRNMWKHGLYKVDGVVAREVNGNWEITDLRSVLPLGEYKSKERCLEIIDEIQSLFCDFLVCRDVDFGDLDLKKELGLGGLIYHSKNLDEPTIEYHERSSIVYEMPKE